MAQILFGNSIHDKITLILYGGVDVRKLGKLINMGLLFNIR